MSMNCIPLTLGALALTAACVADVPGPNNNQNRNSGAALGATAGVLAGIASGNTSEERTRNAALAGIVGAGIGAGIGNALDRQEEELRQSLGGNVDVTNDGSNLTVTLPDNILFAVDSSTLGGNSQASLNTLAASLVRYPNSTVRVIGHTDNTGAAGYNQTLSQQRAQSVTSVLINGGVAPSRISAIGRGEDAPVASNLTPDGRQQNRRVEVIITPN
jgi:outer membrane protein OmpA-like peptidoglycan-associated protein